MRPEIQKALQNQTPPGKRTRRASVQRKAQPKAAQKTTKAAEAKGKKE